MSYIFDMFKTLLYLDAQADKPATLTYRTASVSFVKHHFIGWWSCCCLGPTLTLVKVEVAESPTGAVAVFLVLVLRR